MWQWCGTSLFSDSSDFSERDSCTKPTDENNDEYTIKRYCLEDCLVYGLSDSQINIGRRDGSSNPRREGMVQTVDKKGVRHCIPITADTPIADGYYTLVGWAERWVVAHKTMHGLIKKISVIQVAGLGDKKTISEIGQSFGESSLRLI